MATAFNLTTGFYKQADLERMDDDEIQSLIALAEAQAERHYEAEAGPSCDDMTCERCEYLELLVGAANDIYLKRVHPELKP